MTKDQKQSVENMSAFLRTLPGFDESRADELLAHYVDGIRSVEEPRERALEEARRRIREHEAA